MNVVGRQYRPGERGTAIIYQENVEANASEAARRGHTTAGLRPDDGRQVLRHISHTGLLPPLQEATGRQAEGAETQTT